MAPSCLSIPSADSLLTVQKLYEELEFDPSKEGKAGEKLPREYVDIEASRAAAKFKLSCKSFCRCLQIDFGLKTASVALLDRKGACTQASNARLAK